MSPVKAAFSVSCLSRALTRAHAGRLLAPECVPE
jgi:hypothetical protein